MRVSRTGMCIWLGCAYLALGLIIPRSGLQGFNPWFSAIFYTALMMLVQFGFAISIARLQMVPWRAILVAAAGTISLVAMKWACPTSSTFQWCGEVMLIRNLCLIIVSCALGSAISYIIREPNLLLPVVVFAALVDFWSLTWGPLGHILEEKPALVAAMSVHMVAPASGMPPSMIGMGDFLFMALFFAVLYRFEMNACGAFWLGYVLLTVSLLVVLLFDVAVPALVPMSLAVVAANVRRFKLRREELLATLYVGCVLVLALLVSALLLAGRT